MAANRNTVLALKGHTRGCNQMKKTCIHHNPRKSLALLRKMRYAAGGKRKNAMPCF